MMMMKFYTYLVRILIKKDNTEDVLENKFYIKEIKEKKRKDKNDKMLQICCNLPDLSVRECPVNKFL